MEVKLRLAKAISASYYSSHSGQNNTDQINNLLDKILAHLNFPEDRGSDRERSAMVKVRSVLVWMKQKGCDTPYELNDLMARLRSATGDDDRLYDLFCKTLLLVDDPDAARDKVKEVHNELMEFIAVEELESLLRRATRQLGFDRDKIEDIRNFKEELVAKIQSLSIGGKSRAATVVRTIDLSDVSSVAEVFHLAQIAIDPKSILKLPFKAANRMTGDQGGARRGEWSNVSALPGQNKSGQLLDTFVSMCMFNTPVLFDESKKPLNLYFTIEDKLELVFQKLYVLLNQYEFGLPVVIKGISPTEMAEYVYSKLTRNGHTVKIMELPGGMSSDDYLDILRSFEDEGYEIISCGCDYVNLLGKQGIPVQVAGDEVQLLHRKLRSWCSPHNVFHYTAHQLSTDAKTLARQFPEDYLKRLPGKGYYEGCKKLDTEFDYEYMVAKTQHSGAWWQEVCWAKHRKIGATLDHDKYYALKFLEYPMLGFRYDVELEEDLSYPKVGGRNTTGSGVRDWTSFGEDE